MDPSWEARFPPTASKACSRCHSRKVKCDLTVPRCSACQKQNEQCNITECVTYSYAAVKSLQDRIKELQAKVDSLSQGTAEQPPQDLEASRFGDLRKEAEEIGVLAIGRPNSYVDRLYLGSATGSTFARIFFKQIDLKSPIRQHASRPPMFDLDRDLFCHNAALPPQPVAKQLLAEYIRRIHIWWPFVSLPFLRASVGCLYEDPARCSPYQKFLVLMVLALASAHSSESQEYRRMMDLNSPSDYFQTGLRYFLDFHDHPRDIQGLQCVLLLSLWMLNSNIRSHGDDLWHLSRYAMSAAIEMGLHRRSAAAGDFSYEDTEVRNRTWWCVYSLERQIALITGRVLSIRDHAIDAPKPVENSMDSLTNHEAQFAPTIHRLNVKLFNHLVRLRQIGGRVLESVYIARGADGRASRTTFQNICDEIDKIQQELQSWKRDTEALDIEGTREYSEIKVEYGLLLLLMYRPSPTFMIPSHEMVEISSRAVSGTVRQWTKLETHHGISAVCRCFRHVHAVLMVGLAGLYCDWYTKTMARNSDSHVLHTHGNDVAACIDIIDRGIAWMKEDSLLKYRDLLQAARIKVYGPAAWDSLSSQAIVTDHSSAAPINSSNGLGMFDSDGLQSQLFFQGDVLETYVSQVTGYFDTSHVNMDEGLAAWYGSFLDELQPNDNAELG
ncbi:branched-chain amino acid [Colletotrichum truncatum]|uniref:Branched-chain amino acid n=1 Tax=Colletotrichum truncatum TaxID=5467 RepID=A0ACC3ZCH3_COLTU|nr:branched-chain amino acid [Colletotrichum truncatum]KAF6797756.1 branched-chain amino acid [Colletotrichum truncatum]